MARIYYARFGRTGSPNKENATYLLWVKEHKSGWGIHSIYAPSHIAEFKEGAAFWELNWGAWTRDHMSHADAMGEFKRVCQRRFDHDYVLACSGVVTVDGDTEPLPIVKENHDQNDSAQTE